MPQVIIAELYDPYRLSSLGNAEYMLLRQENFPLDYDEALGDKRASADHDRLLMWDHDHFRGVCKKHLNTGELGIGHWIRNASVPECLAFVKDALKADTKIEWTGFRVTGTVNRSNGYPVYTLELFHKGEKSETEVYSDEFAPNVSGKDALSTALAKGLRKC